MPLKTSKLLVVDASIVHAAGATDQVAAESRHCREFLKAVRRICHRIIMTDAINQEWRKHASVFSADWRVSMVSIRKQTIETADVDDDLRTLVDQVSPAPAVTAIMMKDVILLEAALKADRIVASMDDQARGHFAAAAKRIERIQEIVWVNPCRDPEQVIEWLEGGAKPRASYQLHPKRRRAD